VVPFFNFFVHVTGVVGIAENMQSIAEIVGSHSSAAVVNLTSLL